MVAGQKLQFSGKIWILIVLPAQTLDLVFAGAGAGAGLTGAARLLVDLSTAGWATGGVRGQI